MAKNLRAKMPADDTLLVSDSDSGAMDRFMTDVKGAQGVEAVKSTREVAERSVSPFLKQVTVYHLFN